MSVVQCKAESNMPLFYQRYYTQYVDVVNGAGVSMSWRAMPAKAVYRHPSWCGYWVKARLS